MIYRRFITANLVTGCHLYAKSATPKGRQHPMVKENSLFSGAAYYEYKLAFVYGVEGIGTFAQVVIPSDILAFDFISNGPALLRCSYSYQLVTLLVRKCLPGPWYVFAA